MEKTIASLWHSKNYTLMVPAPDQLVCLPANMTSIHPQFQEIPKDVIPPGLEQRAATANQAAAMVFPEVAQRFDAFFEKESTSLDWIPRLDILDLSQKFWALSLGILGRPKEPIVFVREENQFRRYDPSKGLYVPLSESQVINAIMNNLDSCVDLLPHKTNALSFIALKNRKKLKPVLERARDLLAVEESYFQERRYLHAPFANGMLQLDNNRFHPSNPSTPVRSTLPVKYDPNARCDVFLSKFLAHILNPEDIDLLQRYLSQILEGVNHSQSILILTGDAGWGKSTLMKILGSLIGWDRVGIVREQLFHNEFELAHYANKNLLLHPDMPTEFLNRPEGSIFKQLCGGDPLWAGVKANDERFVFHGNFPIVLSCNGRPKIYLDEDSDAWRRRLAVLTFKTPPHDRHVGKLAEIIVRSELSGVLNWLLEGRAKLAADGLQLKQTPEQKARSAALLLGSESPSAFVRCCLVKKKDSEIGVVEMYSAYQSWCREMQIRPVDSRCFTQEAKDGIEMELGLRYRHDLGAGEGQTVRGWKGMAFVERTVAEKLENESN